MRFRTFLFWKNKIKNQEIYPDEIFIDSRNLPDFDTHQFEGRFEKPIGQYIFTLLCVCFVVFSFGLLWKLGSLQVAQGAVYAAKSESNSLKHTTIFSERGVIYDRNGTLLAWNEPNPETSDFALRKYTEDHGFAHILGYVKYPSKDSSGVYYSEDYQGHDGIEEMYDSTLTGTPGLKLIETNAMGKTISQSIVNPPQSGQSITLSIDSVLQKKLYEFMSTTAHDVNYTGGAGVIMDVHTGEVVALVSFPEYNPNVITDGKDAPAINRLLSDKNKPFLNRVLSGLYTPGSIVKPFLSLGVLTENLIDPATKILSTGSIEVPNPYDPTKKSVFVDWKAHGWVDMRHAIAVSSNVYFYEVGGGFGDQKGLGIERIGKYMKLFGFGTPLNEGYFKSEAGIIPNPTWKKEHFSGEDWLLGDTYHTAIGQYGFQVTPLQMVRGVAAIASNGKLFTPTIFKSDKPAPYTQIPNVSSESYKVVQEGMRLGALEGTAKGFNIPGIEIAAKTGTAELGLSKDFVNSWVIGFYPYTAPHYAFTVLMEHGPRTNTIGALYVMRQLVEWMQANAPEYLK